MSDEQAPMPPATFEFLVYSLRTQAEMGLGLIQFEDAAEEQDPDLEVARHSIDMLAMIAEKTKGNLSADEEGLLQTSLAEMRYLFVNTTAEPSRIIVP